MRELQDLLPRSLLLLPISILGRWRSTNSVSDATMSMSVWRMRGESTAISEIEGSLCTMRSRIKSGEYL